MHRDIALDAPFEGPLVEAMKAALLVGGPGRRGPALLPLAAAPTTRRCSTLGITGYGFAPLQLPADLDFAPMFHGIDERVPVSALEFGTRVLQRFIATC